MFSWSSLLYCLCYQYHVFLLLYNAVVHIPSAALCSRVSASVNLLNCFYVLADICAQCHRVLNQCLRHLPLPCASSSTWHFPKKRWKHWAAKCRRAGVWSLGIGESFISSALFWILAQKIHISSATYDALLTDDAYEIELRGEIEVKVTAFP